MRLQSVSDLRNLPMGTRFKCRMGSDPKLYDRVLFKIQEDKVWFYAGLTIDAGALFVDTSGAESIEFTPSGFIVDRRAHYYYLDATPK